MGREPRQREREEPGSQGRFGRREGGSRPERPAGKEDQGDEGPEDEQPSGDAVLGDRLEEVVVEVLDPDRKVRVTELVEARRDPSRPDSRDRVRPDHPSARLPEADASRPDGVKGLARVDEGRRPPAEKLTHVSRPGRDRDDRDPERQARTQDETSAFRPPFPSAGPEHPGQGRARRRERREPGPARPGEDQAREEEGDGPGGGEPARPAGLSHQDERGKEPEGHRRPGRVVVGQGRRDPQAPGERLVVGGTPQLQPRRRLEDGIGADEGQSPDDARGRASRFPAGPRPAGREESREGRWHGRAPLAAEARRDAPPGRRGTATAPARRQGSPPAREPRGSPRRPLSPSPPRR